MILPFTFNFMGTNYTTVNISSNGNIHVGPANDAYNNTCLPNSISPNGLIAALWDDLDPSAGGNIYTTVSGTSPNQVFVIEWRDVWAFGTGASGTTFEIQLIEGTKEIWILYQDTLFGATNKDNGASATAGIENCVGTAANQYTCNRALLTNNKILHFWIQ
ncbi:MAG: hypothetical protein ACRDHL_07490 [Candidatus Promineifilaceae bacterium]